MSLWRSLVGSGRGVVVFSKRNCPFCVKAKVMFTDLGVAFTAHEVDKWDPEQVFNLKTESKHSTFPNIWIEAQQVGGFDKLRELESSKELYKILDSVKLGYKPRV
jgi:glutaredoxin